MLILAPATAATRAEPGVWRGLVSVAGAPAVNRCIPDINLALSSLYDRGRASSFRYDRAPDLDGLFRHFQGITRLGREDGIWLAVSRSGSPHAVAIVGPGGVAAEITAPHGLTHAGGLQALGQILAVPYEQKQGRSVVILYDVSEPRYPRKLYEVDRSDVPPPSAPGHASAVALARLADGRVALIVGVRSSKVLDLYLSNQADLDQQGLRFDRVATLAGAVEGRFQSHNLVTQCDGTLFLVGAYNSGFPGPGLGADMVRWYRLSQSAEGSVRLEAQGKRKVKCESCNFGAAAGVYVAPGGELMLYGIEHRGTGPNRTVMVEEFRALPQTE